MAPSGKWIEELDAEGSVEDAARNSLQSRLEAVQYWLPLAGYLAERDVEHVHRLRVSTRRAMASLELYRDCLPGKPSKWLRKRLKKVRRAAGDARDLDVLGQRLRSDYGRSAEPVLELIAARRMAVQPAIERMADRCRRDDRLARKTEKLLRGIHPPKDGASEPSGFREWAAERLALAADEFFAAAPRDSANAAPLHKFRICAKALRYTIELLAPAFGPEMKKVHYPIVEELQEKLGAVQDHATARDRLSTWAKEVGDPATQQVLRELSEEESRRLEEQREKFREWWTTNRLEALRQGLTSQAA